MWFEAVWSEAVWSEAVWSEAVWSKLASPASILLAAAGLDYIVGDPWSWPHPVQAMGKAINLYAQWALSRMRSPQTMRGLGVVLGVGTIIGSALVSWAGLQIIEIVAPDSLSPWLRWAAECVLLASCFAGRSLRRAADEVMAPLQRGDVASARQTLAMYVGRDTEQLSEAEIYRAVLETASENAIDGVLAPLFYAILGACFGLAGPVAIAYKAASTLDSMVGYRREPYRHLGWFSARLEDALTWVPCRIGVLTIALLSRRAGHVLRLCQRDADADPSPNAGWSECAYAAALGVQLGGENTYRGERKFKPLLGDALRPITCDVINEAFTLTRQSFLIGLIGGALGLYLISTV